MKVDNFELVENLLFGHLDKEITTKTDKVILGRIIRRRKENPEDERREWIVKRYTFSTKEKFIEYRDEIKKLCHMFNARFYIAVCIKSMKDIAYDMADAMPKIIRREQYYFTRRMFDNVGDANKGIKEHRLWVFDIDDNIYYDPIIKYMKRNGLYSHIKAEIPTINGIHLLVKPHDTRYINDYKTNTIILTHDREVTLSTAIDVKKNAMTLCYYSDEG